jgi:hypothetical protein
MIVAAMYIKHCQSPISSQLHLYDEKGKYLRRLKFGSELISLLKAGTKVIATNESKAYNK